MCVSVENFFFFSFLECELKLLNQVAKPLILTKYAILNVVRVIYMYDSPSHIRIYIMTYYWTYQFFDVLDINEVFTILSYWTN